MQKYVSKDESKLLHENSTLKVCHHPFMYVMFSSPFTSHKHFVTLFYIKHNMCTSHSGQDLHVHRAYGCA